MNTRFKMPGFTAEASLYRSGRQYRMANRSRGGRGILPQLPIGFCMADCDFTETDPFSRDICKLRCLDEGGGGGDPDGPGGLSCRPSCGPCGRVPGKSGRWKTCIKRNCDDYEVRCR